MRRIGVFGASFNPPTLGHADVINQALPHFDEILLVPSLSHPFGKILVSLEHRLAMLQLFLDPWKNLPPEKNIQISLIEKNLYEGNQNAKPIYTFDVLCALERHSAELSFILGPDNSDPIIWQKFYRYQEIEKKWPLFHAHENIPIHSTLVREVCLKYAAEDLQRQKALIELVGKSIADYIEKHKLYRENPHA